MLARVVLLANGAEPNYATGSYRRKGDEVDGGVYVFTRDRVIVGRAAGPCEDPDVHVWTFPRSELTEIEYTTDVSILPIREPRGNEPPAIEWPGRVSIIARYAGREDVRLPASEPYDPATRASLNVFLPSLLADLHHANKRSGPA